MKLKLFQITIFTIFLFSVDVVHAKHILGGDMSYECVGETADQITLRVKIAIYRDLRDPEGAECDGAQIGVWRGGQGSWQFVAATLERTPEAGSNIVIPENPPCADAGTGTLQTELSNEQCTYLYEITLDKIDQNYLIAYQRCCRNAAITNLVNPEQFGAAFSVELTPAAQNMCNNSPEFLPYRTAIFCAEESLEINNNASDVDGDSVVYNFCIPVSSGGMDGMNTLSCNYVKPNPELCGPEVFRDVQFLSPSYSFSLPLGQNANIALDDTGFLTALPQLKGEFVMGVCADEYRGGVLLSRLRRDLQVVITDCSPAEALLSVSPEDEPFILNTGPDGSLEKEDTDSLENVYIVRSCGDTEVEFDLRNDSYDSESFFWFFDLGGEIFESDDQTPKIDFPTTGIYNGFLIADPEFPPCSDTANVLVEILPTVEAQFELSFDDCRAGDIEFEDDSETKPDNADNTIVEWLWDFGDGNTSSSQNPKYRYQTPGTKNISLQIFDDNGCSNIKTTSIDWFPVPEPRVRPDGFLGCAPQNFNFQNLSSPIDSTYEVEWDFGDGSQGPERFEINPSHIYEEEGEYDVSLTIRSPTAGCEETKRFRNLIEVLQGFETSFEINPEDPKYLGEIVRLTNTSDLGATSFVWEFGPDQVSFLENPTFSVRDTGIIEVRLTATWENGCSNTTTKSFEIIPCLEVRFPNAFTPNGDGKNEEFRGLVFGPSPLDYRLAIFDRWGKLIFESNDPSEGWNGKHQNNGADLPPGVYMYLVSFDNPVCDQEPKPGFATLIR